MAEITKNGMYQRDLVTLLSRSPGSIWFSKDNFADVGNAALGLVGGSKPTGMLFDSTAAEEIDANWYVPAYVDTTKVVNAHIYWSSADTGGDKVVWDIDYLARAAGEDVGAAVANLTTTDTDSVTADVLNVTEALPIPINILAAADLLYINLRREAADTSDSLADDVHFYGLRLDYTTLPKVTI